MCFGYGYPMQSLRRALGAFTRKCGAFLQLGLTPHLQLYQFCAVNPEVFYQSYMATVFSRAASCKYNPTPL